MGLTIVIDGLLSGYKWGVHLSSLHILSFIDASIVLRFSYIFLHERQDLSINHIPALSEGY